MPHPLAMFDYVPIINLAERTDRRREMTREIERIGGFDGMRIGFFDAVRPIDRGDFPSVGARGCFMSHLAILRSARERGVERLLILEDDLDFAPDFETAGRRRLEQLAMTPWNIFYGVYGLVSGDAVLPPSVGPVDPVKGLMTTPFVAFQGDTISRVTEFLEGILTRPAGSPDYGPMHVDGAYSVFRQLHPDVVTYAASPPLGRQRSSRSDISEKGWLLDQLPLARSAKNVGRRLRSLLGT